MENFHEIKILLEDHLTLFDELIVSEDQKLEAISINDVDALNIYMKEEQVFIMRLKGLDKKRDKLLEEMGLGDKTFSELISHFEGEEGYELNAIFENLSSKIIELQSATESTKKFIDLHLHSLTNLLSELQSKGDSHKKNLGFYSEKKI